MTKSEIIEGCQAEIDQRISTTRQAIESARDSANSEQKSTAGDKHDTARAMAQFEQEKLSKQFLEQSRLKEMVQRLDPNSSYTEVQAGALVTCSNGVFFVGVGLGKLMVGSQSVYCVSMVSPVGQALIGKSSGQEFNVNGRAFKILEVQ